MLLTGAFTHAAKQVKVAVIPSQTRDWQSIVRNSSFIVNATQQGTTGLSFLIPSSFPVSVYGFEIEDPSSPPTLRLANVPSIDWVIGVPPLTTPENALQHEVHDCGVEPGATLRILARISPVYAGHSSIGNREGPSAAALGIGLQLHRSPGFQHAHSWNIHSLGGDISLEHNFNARRPDHCLSILVIHSQARKCPDLVGDGATDNTSILQSCLGRNAPAAGAKQVVYIAIPAGDFMLASGVTAHSYEFLNGASAGSTRFFGKPRSNPPKVWFAVPQHLGLANLSFEAPANPSLLASTDSTTGNPATSGHLFFSDLNFKSNPDAAGNNVTRNRPGYTDLRFHFSFRL